MLDKNNDNHNSYGNDDGDDNDIPVTEATGNQVRLTPSGRKSVGSSCQRKALCSCAAL